MKMIKKVFFATDLPLFITVCVALSIEINIGTYSLKADDKSSVKIINFAIFFS